MSALVRPATLADTEEIAAIHHEAFPRQRESLTWVKATLSAVPRILSFVLLLDDRIVGYIFWAQKSGIRPAAVLELEQVAVLSEFQRRGNGEHLIRESLTLVVAELRSNGQSVKSVLVSTRADNDATHLYSRVFGARIVASIEGLYSATEVLMLAENFDA
jgi:ribosomal protein S18 acetylase RimI-like enzyme